MLTRWFPLYVKKRGHRRTGTARAGWVGEALFFTSLALLGGIGVAALVSWWIVPNWQANHDFVANTCTVVEKRIGERPTAAGGVEFRPEFLIEYSIGDQTFRKWTYDATQDFHPDRASQEEVLTGFYGRRAVPVLARTE